MISKTDKREAQASPTIPARKLSGPNGHKARDEFICAALVCVGLTPLELKIAVRLAVFFNCTTGQCNPGYPTLAKSLGVATRSARRSVAALMAYGIVATDQSAGGSHDQKANFSLFIPPPRVTRLTSSVRVTVPTSSVTGDDPNRRRVTRAARTGDEQPSGRVTPRGPHNTEKENTEKNTEQERGSAARSARVERERPALETGIDQKRETPDGARLDRAQIEKCPIDRPLDASSNMGRAATANAEPAKPFDPKFEAFEKLKRAYPQHRVGDVGEAYRAFCAAVSATGRLSTVGEAITNLSLSINHGAEVPILAEAFSNIAYDAPIDQRSVSGAVANARAGR